MSELYRMNHIFIFEIFEAELEINFAFKTLHLHSLCYLLSGDLSLEKNGFTKQNFTI